MQQDVAGYAPVISVENPVSYKCQRENGYDKIYGVDDISMQHLIVVIAFDEEQGHVP